MVYIACSHANPRTKSLCLSVETKVASRELSLRGMMHEVKFENMVHSLVELSAFGKGSAAVLFGRLDSRQQLGLNPGYVA